ncbi:MAG: MFS transporter [Anaerolineae bacterium]|nr:MFS transporter [Anaerolineae bacterium]
MGRTLKPTTLRPARVLFPLGLSTAFSLIGDSTLYAVLPTHAEVAGIALAAVGIVLSVNRIARLVLNGPMGLAYDRWPRRCLYVPALLVGALSTALYAVTGGLWPLILGRLLWGIAWSGIWIGGSTIILDVTTDADRGRWSGLYQTWFFGGVALGTLAGGIVTDQLGYPAAMWMGAALTALGALVALVFLPETRGARLRGATPPALESGPPAAISADLWGAASLQGVNRFVVAGALAATMALLVQERLPALSAALGVSTLTGVVTAGQMALGISAALVAGILSDRWGSRWRVAVTVMAIGTTGLLLLVWGAPAAVVAALLLVPLAGGSTQTLVNAVIGDVADERRRGRAVGIVHTANDIGSALGPPVAYAVLPWAELRGVYFVCAALFATQFALAAWFRRREVM